MRFRIALWITAVCLLIGRASSAGNIAVLFDENGHAQGLISKGLQTDPVSGDLTLAYSTETITGSPKAGDVVIIGAGGPGNDPDGQISDLLRFNNELNLVFVFSDNRGKGEDDMADQGIPELQRGAPRVRIDEHGLEDISDGVEYTPKAAQPGFFSKAQTVTYNFVSDGIVTPLPEPSSFVLVVSGLVIAGVFGRRITWTKDSQ